jgi:hypothetical protein
MEDSVSVGMYGGVSTVSAGKKQYEDKAVTLVRTSIIQWTSILILVVADLHVARYIFV